MQPGCNFYLGCNCYVALLDDETQFCLRWGAHNPRCLVYRESGDPVDRMKDQDYRKCHETETLRNK